jgi:pyrroloquinoline quinone biosynthesis protein E
MLTGDAANTDPVCSKSLHHDKILAARAQAEHGALSLEQLQHRNEKASKLILKV